MFWRNSRYIFITLIGFIIVFGGFYLFFLNIFAGKIEDNEGKIRDLNYKLSEFYGDNPSVKRKIPMDEYYQRIKKLQADKKENVNKLKETLAIRPEGEYVINKGEYPGSYFKKILDQKRMVLLQEASKRNIDIPESLGFGEALPPDKDADGLLKFLFIKEQLIRLAINSGIKGVSSIEHFSLVETGPDKDNKFINEYPVKITIQGTITDILKMLYKMRSGQQFLILRNLEIHSANKGPDDQEEILGVTMDVAGMTFTDIKIKDIPVSTDTKEPGKDNKPIVPIGI